MNMQGQDSWLFEKMIDAAPLGFCNLSLDGRFLRVNPKFCEMLGYTREELASLMFSALTHPDDRAQDLQAFNDMLDGKLSTYHREKRYLRKDGSLLWVDLTSTILRDEQGQALYFVTVMQEIGRRKRTEENLSASERRFKTLFQQAPFSCQLLGLDGRTLQVNAAWERLWQVPKEAIENYVLKEYNVLTDPQLKAKGITPYIRAAYTGESVVTDPIYYDPADIGQPGRPRWLSAFVHPIKDEHGKVVEVVLIHHDVSERVEFEAKLKRSKEAAESASRLKSAFLANMSHEIRTPLGAILGFTDLLKNKELSEQDREKYFDIIHRSGQALTQIINDILDLARVEAGSLRVEKRWVRVREILEESLGLLEIEAQKKNLTLSLHVHREAPEWIETDPVRLRQIVINLVGNAVKFTHEGGVEVSLENDDTNLILRVKDSGIGIPRESQSWLFQAFSQMDDSSTRKFGGTGLGLALSRRLANALGGEIFLEESQPGKGSTFTFTHHKPPLVAPGVGASVSIAPQAMPSNEFSLVRKKILVVDDSADNRLLIEHMLKVTKATIDCAVNGDEAIGKVGREKYDVILMDVQMPVMDGLEATRRLRRMGETMPIIALTAHAMKEDIQRSAEAGCNAHVSKPITSAALIRTIADHIR